MKHRAAVLLLTAITVAFSTTTLPGADNYEPNNSFTTAYPLGMGDSIVKNATVQGTVGFDSQSITIGSDIDVDIYKITLSGGTMVSATAFRWFNGSSEDTNTQKWRWRIFICDSTHRIVCGGTPIIEAFQPWYNGIYYLAVTSMSDIDYACRYGLSISERAVLSQQTVDVPDTGLHEDTSGYSLRVKFDTANVTINLTLSQKTGGRIQAKMLLPGDFDTAVNTTGAIKAVWIDADPGLVSSIKRADIAIPYSTGDISGPAESTLKALWLNDSTQAWMPVDYSVDTVNRLVIVHTTHFSIYGIFSNSVTGTISRAATRRPDGWSVEAFYQPAGRIITVRIGAHGSDAVTCALYTMQGRRVAEHSTYSRGAPAFNWNVGTLARGTYCCMVRSGTLTAKSMVIIGR